MLKLRVLVLAFLFAAAPLLANAQAPPSGCETLQSLLEEVRKLRQDLQSTAATVQRMQILLYRIRSQMDVVSQARQRLDESQAVLTQMNYQHEQASAQIKQQEESFNRSDDPNSRKYIEENLERMKRWLEQMAQAEPEAQAKEAERANDLRIEQAKLNDFEQQLDRLDNQLSAARQPPARSR
jgi:lysyl-tRNA synthetase class I